MPPVYQQMTLSPKLGMVEISTLKDVRHLLLVHDFKTSYGLLSVPGKYCIVVNYVVFEANKIKFKPSTDVYKGSFFLSFF